MIKVYIADKTNFSSSENIIRAVLEKFYEITSPVLLKTENGKPYLENDSVFFSLSHTKEKYFLAVAPYPVGIDAEKSDRTIDPLVAKRYFPKESFESGQSLLRKWLQTESKVKLLGSTLQKELTAPSERQPFFSFHETDGHTVCVCSDELAPIEYVFINF